MDNSLIKEFNRVFYEVEAEIYDDRHPEVIKGNQEWWDDVGAKIIKPRGRVTGVKIIDIGCGTGFVGDVVLKHLGKEDQFICYDLTPAMLKEARRKLAGHSDCRLEFISGDADNLPFPANSFDVITLNAILHHLADFSPLLKEVDRILKKGGHVIVAHEHNKLFFSSLTLRFASSLYKLMGGGKSITDEMQTAINEKLKQKGVITRNLSKDDILKMVEFNSPVEQDSILVEKDKGFIPTEIVENYFPNYKLVEIREYSTFFIRPVFDRNKWLGILVKCISKLLLGRGNLFSLISQK